MFRAAQILARFAKQTFIFLPHGSEGEKNEPPRGEPKSNQMDPSVLSTFKTLETLLCTEEKEKNLFLAGNPHVDIESPDPKECYQRAEHMEEKGLFTNKDVVGDYLHPLKE